MNESIPNSLDRADRFYAFFAIVLLAAILTLILIHKVREDKSSSGKKDLEKMSHSEAGDTFMDIRKGLLR